MRGCAWLLAALLLAGCGHAVPTLGGSAAAGDLAAQSKAKKKSVADVSLDAKLHVDFRLSFDALDLDRDGVLTAAELNVSASTFHKVLGKYDTAKNGQITFEAYYGTARAAAMLTSVQSRATVSALGVGGHVTLDKAQFMLGVYLQDRLTDSVQRAKAIVDAFIAADTDRNKVLTEPELEAALGRLEAVADLRVIQHKLGVPDTDPAATGAATP